MDNFAMNLDRLEEILKSLIGKKIQIHTKDGSTLRVILKELLPTGLIVNPTKKDKKIGIVPIDSISYLLELMDEDAWDKESPEEN